MRQEAAPAITLAKGVKGSGKTEWLIEQIGAVLENGAQPEDLIVLAASPAAAIALKQRIEDRLGFEAEVVVPMQLSEEIVASRGIPARKGEGVRAMLPHEKQMLIEDLKAAGMNPGRLKGMFDFFEHSWMDSKPSEEFIAYQDELDLHNLCMDCLSFYGSALESELPLAALGAIEADAELKSSKARPYVFMDDSQLMSSASQRLALALTEEQIFVTADDQASFPVFEAYPSPIESSWESLSITPDCSVTLKNAGDAHAELVEEESPAEELEALIARISRLAFDKPYARIYVACPNKAWKSMVAGGLHKAKLRCFVTGSESVLMRKASNPMASAPIKAASLLLLAANPNDGMAWRTLLGCDVHLTNKAGMAALRNAYASRGIGIVDAIESACSNEVTGMLSHMIPDADRYTMASVKDITTRYRAAKLVLAKLYKLTGAELIAELCKAVCQDDVDEARRLARVVAELTGEGKPLAERDASDLAGSLIKAVRYPSIPLDANIIVGDYAGLTGLTPDHVFLTGSVEGFVIARRFFDPAEVTEEKLLSETSKRETMIYQTIGGTTPATVTAFKQLPAEEAERLGVRIRRIGVKGGKRVASAARSKLVERYVEIDEEAVTSLP